MSYFIIKNVELFKTIFETKSSPFCYFCNLYGKTPFHIFYQYGSVQCLQNTLVLQTLTL